MLSNQEYNEQLDNGPHEPIMATYNKRVHKYENNITKKEFEYLKYFYSLPQIHKSKVINEACTISQDNFVEIEAPETIVANSQIEYIYYRCDIYLDSSSIEERWHL